jgi:hypothetical protein
MEGQVHDRFDLLFWDGIGLKSSNAFSFFDRFDQFHRRLLPTKE